MTFEENEITESRVDYCEHCEETAIFSQGYCTKCSKYKGSGK